eukprot:CAMPEP_0116899236 /NCGR_PEP_ID=MMETSP0467-20121206/7855_1 /TAXON_ID=283647 /ORGANISM="Mesodinium pulex, Strain SPMC105" /LENGTH=137 /DNA_ID=CAMNT_0004571955 /DNA_START=1075 /DNA_END=1488 /DNA_ORIENTATION=+
MHFLKDQLQSVSGDHKSNKEWVSTTYKEVVSNNNLIHDMQSQFSDKLDHLQDISQELHKFNLSMSATNSEINHLNKSMIEIDSVLHKETKDFNVGTEVQTYNAIGYKWNHTEDLDNVFFNSDVPIKNGKHYGYIAFT